MSIAVTTIRIRIGMWMGYVITTIHPKLNEQLIAGLGKYIKLSTAFIWSLELHSYQFTF